jgi:hypothetical protein
LNESANGFLILGCGSDDKVLAIDKALLIGWLENLNTSTRANGTIHWHLHVYQENGKYYLEQKKGKGRIDISNHEI